MMKQHVAANHALVGVMGAKPTRGMFGVIKHFCKAAWQLQLREKTRIRAEIHQIPGLLRLLMKPRNGLRWSKEDRADLASQMQRISRLGLYLTVLAVPGTSLTLPLLAWWLDRRRLKRDSAGPHPASHAPGQHQRPHRQRQ